MGLAEPVHLGKKTRFKSLHDCFIRELGDGVRPINRDPAILVSPCDAIVGACGLLEGTELIQAKGFPYLLDELLCDPELANTYRDGRYVTLRLTSSMYHRFHAPHDCRVEQVRYISGDTWNVNPTALKRVPKLYCRNERAVLQTRLAATGDPITLVPVAAILVASIRLHFLDTVTHVRDCGSRAVARRALQQGRRDGLVEHGSTIILFRLAPSRCARAYGRERSAHGRAAAALAVSGLLPPQRPDHELLAEPRRCGA